MSHGMLRTPAAVGELQTRARGLDVRALNQDVENIGAIDLPFIKDQKPTGTIVNCCVSAAVTVIAEQLSEEQRELSMLFNYYFAEVTHQNEHIALTTGLIAAKKHGLCMLHLHDHPIEIASIDHPLSPVAVTDGKKRCVDQFFNAGTPPNNIARWKSHINANIPVMIMFYLYRNLYLQIPMNNHIHPKGQILIGELPPTSHAVVVIGYDDSNELFLIQDCQGPAWADGGRWWLPYGLANSNQFISDAYFFKSLTDGD